MFEDLVRRVLGDVEKDVRRRLLAELALLGRESVVPRVADAVGRLVIKSLDGVVAAAVKTLSKEDAGRLAAAYLAEVQDQLEQFSAALLDYLPHAVAVEQAKKEWGGQSREANAARRERKLWMDEAKAEVRDIFAAVAGDETVD